MFIDLFTEIWRLKIMTSDNNKSEAQLELFESDKPDNKMREISRKETTLGNVIYQGTKRRRPRKKYLVASSKPDEKR